LLFGALEHIVLRVLILQTLVNNSVVKYSTHLVPSLVSGMKYSTHHLFRRISRAVPIGLTGLYQLGFSSKGAPVDEEEFDPTHRRSFGGFQHLGLLAGPGSSVWRLL
jgi:hypothetical protein